MNSILYLLIFLGISRVHYPPQSPPVVCDRGVVAAVVLGLGHGLLERVQVRADHVGRQARHLPSHVHSTQHFGVLGYFTEIV